MDNKKINKPLVTLWSLFFLAIVFAFNSQLSAFVTIKTVFNYLSPALIAFVAYNLFVNLGYKISFKFFLFVILSYLFVGIVQNTIHPTFMSFILNNTRGIHESGRGVVSLTTEPSFYGVHCLCLMIFSFMNYDKKQNLIAIPLLMIQLFFLAKTATAIGILAVVIVIFSVIQLFRRKLLYLFIFIFMSFAATISYHTFLKSKEDTRFIKLMKEFINDPLKLAQVDSSASKRLTGTFAPFIAIKENYFMPFGFGRYESFVNELYYQKNYRGLINTHILSLDKKISGGINLILFHFGFIGLLFPLAIYYSFNNKLDNPYFLFSLMLFLLILTTIQLMNAMVGFIIGYALFCNNHVKESSVAHDNTVSII